MIYLLLGAGALLLFFAVSGQGAIIMASVLGNSELPRTVNGYSFEWAANAPANLLGLVRAAAFEAGLTASKLLAVVYVESRGNPKAINTSDPSYGIAQMQLPTARYYDVEGLVKGFDSLYNPDLALQLAARFLADLQRKYAGSYAFAEWVQAYNLGEPKFNKGKRNWSYGGKVKDATGKTVSFGAGDLERMLAAVV